MTDDYVSYEIAKLLKEKGFDATTIFYYDKCGIVCPADAWVDAYKDEYYPFITLSLAMKWLREKYQLLISVDASPIYGKVKDEKGRNTCGLLYWHYMASGEWMNDRYNPQQKAFVVSAKCYEEAVEAALKYVLENLI